ncbi:MAG: hypothetical protein ACPG77_12515 [Nannocystaceae bacterium]
MRPVVRWIAPREGPSVPDRSEETSWIGSTKSIPEGGGMTLRPLDSDVLSDPVTELCLIFTARRVIDPNFARVSTDDQAHYAHIFEQCDAKAPF